MGSEALGPDDLASAAERGARLLRDALGSGSVSELSEAAALFREVLAVAPEDHPGRAGWMFNLGAALLARFEQSGVSADLDEVITTIRQALAATFDQHVDVAYPPDTALPRMTRRPRPLRGYT